MSEDKRPNPGGTGMIIAGLLAVFVGLWMVGQTMATEGEVIKVKLVDLAGEVETMSFELKALSDKIDRMRGDAPEAAPAAAPAAVPAAAAEAAAAPEDGE